MNAVAWSVEFMEMQITYYSIHCQPFIENLLVPGIMWAVGVSQMHIISISKSTGRSTCEDMESKQCGLSGWFCYLEKSSFSQKWKIEFPLHQKRLSRTQEGKVAERWRTLIESGFHHSFVMIRMHSGGSFSLFGNEIWSPVISLLNSKVMTSYYIMILNSQV